MQRYHVGDRVRVRAGPVWEPVCVAIYPPTHPASITYGFRIPGGADINDLRLGGGKMVGG